MNNESYVTSELHQISTNTGTDQKGKVYVFVKLTTFQQYLRVSLSAKNPRTNEIAEIHRQPAFFLSAVKTFTAWYLKAILSSITAAKSKYHENAPKLLAGERWTKIPTACLRFPTVCKRAKFRLKVASRGLRCVNHKGYSTERETDLRTAKLETLTTP